MIIKEYSISHDPSQEYPTEWVIEVHAEPGWFQGMFLGIHFPQKLIMIGHCTTWHWLSGEPVGYFWRWWAFYAITRHIKKMNQKEATYVNCRFDGSKDEQDHQDC